MSTTTTNFNITLPEGVDTFNPLIFNNDAFTLIDSIMRTIKNATIGTANQVLSENVNTITRTDSNTNAFIFIASSDYETTQEFYVDGVPVTVRYSDGYAPKNGAYKTNQAVLCYLNGNILTLFINNSELLAAINISYDNSSSALTGTNVQNAIDEVVTRTQTINPVKINISGAYYRDLSPDAPETMFSYWKKDGVIHINGAIYVNTPQSDWYTVAILPEGYRPLHNMYLPTFSATSSSVTTLDVAVLPNGAIQFRRGASGIYYHVNVVI